MAGLGGMKCSFAQSSASQSMHPPKDLLVYVFLNGGMDGLSLIPPRSGENYHIYKNQLRPQLHIDRQDSLPLSGCDEFGMHPAAKRLAQLFNEGRMAIAHATGMMTYESRSHFEATTLLDRGIQEQDYSVNTGWLTRLVDRQPGVDQTEVPLMVPTNIPTEAVMGDPEAVILKNPADFALNDGSWSWGLKIQGLMEKIYQQPTSLTERYAEKMLQTSSLISRMDWQPHTELRNHRYPDTDLAQKFSMVASLCRQDVGLQTVYVPFDGWDTHVKQGRGKTGVFARLTRELSDGIHAFYRDLSKTHAGRFTIIIHSEFGRRAYENSSNGTDHGYGNPMLVLGEHIKGGFYGEFPGLRADQLFKEQDIAVNVDYRDVVSEVLVKRLGHTDLARVFPGYTDYQPLGLVQRGAHTSTLKG